jgi:hypothetical protein
MTKCDASGAGKAAEPLNAVPGACASIEAKFAGLASQLRASPHPKSTVMTSNVMSSKREKGNEVRATRP